MILTIQLRFGAHNFTVCAPDGVAQNGEIVKGSTNQVQKNKECCGAIWLNSSTKFIMCFVEALYNSFTINIVIGGVRTISGRFSVSARLSNLCRNMMMVCKY